MGALTEHHKCPRGPLSRMSDALTTVGLGAFIGGALCYLEERPPLALVLAAAALGGVLTTAVRSAVGGSRS
jgi:hypothetical protein